MVHRLMMWYSPSATDNAVMYIGKDDPDNNTSYYLQGSLDDIRIYMAELYLQLK